MPNEILELEAVETSPLEQVIDQTLIKANVTDAVIAAMKDKYGGLKLRAIDNKEDYLIICEGRKEVRKIGILVEKLTKKGREDAVAIQRKWLSKEKEILGKIAEVQDPLDAEIKKYEDEVVRKEQEEAQRKEQAYMARQTTLLKMEAKYENNCFTLGNVSYEINNIKEADEEIWDETILPKFKREFEKIESVRAEEERKQKEAAEKLKQEQELLAKQQEEFRLQQEQFQKQQAELQKLKDDAAQLERDKQLAIENEERKKMADLVSARSATLRDIGMSYDGTQYDFADIYITKPQVTTLAENEWLELVAKTTEQIKEWKSADAQRQEEKRQQELETARQDAIKKENERIAEENRQNEIRRQQQEQQRQEELAKASDKDKWALYVQQIVAIPFPELKSGIYKGKLNVTKEKIEEIKNL